MATLLIIDDEPNVLYSLQTGLQSESLRIVTAKTARQGLALIEKESPDAVILDVKLPDRSGLDLFQDIKSRDAHLPVIVITAFATTETAIEAMKHGAFEYMLKPVDLRELRETVNKALEVRRIRTVPTGLGDSVVAPMDDQIVGQSPLMQEVYKTIGRFAPQDITVLILGESGTGKELVARAIFQHSKRSERPFLAINCASIPEALLESELFGHEKGAFTGADRQRIGKFEQCNGGTLFLDEIGDMAPTTQAKVLRLLQDQSFERVGGRETIKTDVRIIAATNQKLDEFVAANKFRQDLLYRLNGVTIQIPPLRDRKDDLPLLVKHLIALANPKLDKSVHSVTEEAMQLLNKHNWPGNIRELQNVIRYSVIQAVGDTIAVSSLPNSLRGIETPSPCHEGSPFDVAAYVQSLLAEGDVAIHRKVVAAVDRIVFKQVLDHVRGNQVQASELLGISRTTLRARLQALEHLTE
ncbi:sigma-54 dependent transcriptional regulator [soil metagenome]